MLFFFFLLVLKTLLGETDHGAFWLHLPALCWAPTPDTFFVFFYFHLFFCFTIHDRRGRWDEVVSLWRWTCLWIIIALKQIACRMQFGWLVDKKVNAVERGVAFKLHCSSRLTMDVSYFFFLHFDWNIKSDWPLLSFLLAPLNIGISEEKRKKKKSK